MEGKQRATAPDFFSKQVRRSRRFYLSLTPPSTAPLAVVCGGEELCEPDYAIHRATFPFWSIEFVAGGKGQLRLGEAWHTLGPGVIFSYGPGIAHDITTDPNAPLLKYFVDFTGTRAMALLEQCGLGPGGAGCLCPFVEVQAVLDQLIHDGLRGSGFSGQLCAVALEYLLLKVAESWVPGATKPSRAFATYQRCRQYIVDHSNRLRWLGQIARECRIDQAYLCRLFRRYGQQSPHQLLMRLKMNLAADRLRTANVLVKQVAADLSFDDPLHFSRVFKKTFGVSPETFRRLS